MTNGFGNNIFQYVYAKLLATHHDANLSVKMKRDYYAAQDLLDVGLKLDRYRLAPVRTTKIENPKDPMVFFSKRCRGRNFDVVGYFEDYLIYKKHLATIKSWFVPVSKTNTKDLVLHLRLSDRLFYRNSYDPGMKVEAECFINAMKNFDFNRLHIVTDMKIWDKITVKQARRMKFHTTTPNEPDVVQMGVDYMNSLVEGFEPFDPIVRCNKKISEDFNFIRSFDKILFQHGTLAWWAAAISNASKVGVYEPWRPTKGSRNKNLGKADFPGWFGWKCL